MYDGESDEPEDGFSTDGEIRVNPTSVSRNIENGHSKVVRHSELTLRDLPLGESLDGEPVRQCRGFKNGATSIDQQKVTSMLSNTHQGRSIP